MTLQTSNTDVILIGFNYDMATTITFPWITNILKSYPNNKIYRFHIGTGNEQNALRNLLQSFKSPNERIVEIFCGHGNDEALLGPPHNQADKHYNFYNLSMISALPSSLFAFCCYSGSLFGLAYSFYQHKVFMGFTEKVFLPIDVISELKDIFQEIAEDIVSVGLITVNHEVKFRELISALMSKVETGAIKCNVPEFVLIYLNRYKTSLKRYD